MSQNISQKRYLCALCGRTVQRVNKHHLVPKSQGGREVAELCIPCHKTLHSFFENKTLARELHTIEALQENPDIANYLTWIRKQPDTIIRIRTSKRKR